MYSQPLDPVACSFGTSPGASLVDTLLFPIPVWLNPNMVCMFSWQAEASRRAAEQAKAQEKMQKREARKKAASSGARGQQATTLSKGSSSLGRSDYEGRAEVQQQQQLEAGVVPVGHRNSLRASQEGGSNDGLGGKSGAVQKLPASTDSRQASAAAAHAAGGGSGAATSPASGSCSSSSRSSAADPTTGGLAAGRAASMPATAVAVAPIEAPKGGTALSQAGPAVPAGAEPASATPATAAAGMRVPSPGGKVPRPKRVECVVCLDARAEVMLLPCKHTILCQTCAELVREGGKTCPMCRTPVEGEVMVGEGKGKEAVKLATTAAAAATGSDNNPAALVAAPPAADAASSSSSTLWDALVGRGGRPGHTIAVRTLPSTAAAGDGAVLPSALVLGSAAVTAGSQRLPPRPQPAALSSSSSSSVPSVLQPLLANNMDASSGGPRSLEVAVQDSPPPSVLSATSTWTPPMLQHLFPHGASPHQSRASSSARQPSLAVSAVAAPGLQSGPSSSTVEPGPSPAAALVTSAAAGQRTGEAVVSCSGVPQNILGHFMHEVHGLLSETEAHANALLSQTQAELDQTQAHVDEFQLQVDAARAQLKQRRIQLGERRAQWTQFLDQHRSRMQQLCQKYRVSD